MEAKSDFDYSTLSTLTMGKPSVPLEDNPLVQWVKQQLVLDPERNANDVPYSQASRGMGRGRPVRVDELLHIWRWTGYNFGVDLIVTYYGRTVKFRRNERSEQEVLRSTSGVGRRHLLYWLSVYSVGPLGDAQLVASTGLRSVTMARNAEAKVLTIEKELKLPIIISASFLVTTPLSDDTPEAAQS
ncbi:germ cell-less protein-like 1 [Haemaphysalis longicornis]